MMPLKTLQVKFVKRIACLWGQHDEYLLALEQSLALQPNDAPHTVLSLMEHARDGQGQPKSAESLIEDFILTPLHNMAAPPWPAIPVVDALDEGELLQGSNSIATLLNSKAGRFPGWFKITASCWLNCVTEKLKLCSNATRIVVGSVENIKEVERFVHAQLQA